MNFLKKFTVVALAAVALTACSDDDNGNAATVGGPKIRVVNSTYKIASPGGAITATAIDFMVDSNTTDASSADVEPAVFDDIPGNSIAGLTTTGNASSTVMFSGTGNGFTEFDVGVHSYVAREADSTAGRVNQLYYNTATTPAPYLPRQYLTAGTYYTWVIAGLIPQTGNLTSTTFAFSALVDDPFPPPTLSSGTYQARFRVINAAPYTLTSGAGTTVTVWLTPGTAAPANAISAYAAMGTAGYRNGLSYVNATAGNYWLTIGTSTGSIFWQGPIVLAAGEVRTLIFQNNFTSKASYITADLTTQANYKVTNILDQQY